MGLLCVLLISFAAFALPGITPSVPDFSGQYVYYRDYSFERESYIGILYYDESTYALRYYAPLVNDKKNPKPEKNIHILFTLDSTKNYVELTGERILTAIAPEDTDLVNYIHDFLYEMTKRRQNSGEVTEPKSDYQDYEQFGGKVTLYFNPLIPIFNLEKIVSVDKKTVFQISTAGQLVSSEDQSFAEFSGINEKFSDKTHSFKKNKKAKSQEYTYKASENSKELKIKIDSSWNQVAENFFTLENIAVLTMNEVNANQENQLNVLKRRLILGTDMAYPELAKLKLEETKNETLFKQIFYHSDTDSYTYDFKLLKEIDSLTVNLYTLTVFAGAYEPNKKYFDAILKSFE